MPKKFSAETRRIAQGYYEGGQSPTQTEWTMLDLHGVSVSAKTIDDWHKQYGWRHYELAKQELIDSSNPNLPFGVSKIKDPVFHDCEAIAKSYCRGEGYRKTGPIKPVIQEALREVVRRKEGVPVAVLDYLSKVVLRTFIKETRKNNAFDPRIDIDPERQAIIDAVEAIEADGDEGGD